MVRTETRNLPVRLTDEEWSAAATQLADLGGQIEKLKDEKKTGGARNPRANNQSRKS